MFVEKSKEDRHRAEEHAEPQARPTGRRDLLLPAQSAPDFDHRRQDEQRDGKMDDDNMRTSQCLNKWREVHPSVMSRYDLAASSQNYRIRVDLREENLIA